jgi:hypothetical protein
MNTPTIELDGFEIGIVSELFCERGGDHHELVEQARSDRTRLGHNLDESAVLCVRCMKAIPLQRNAGSSSGRTPDFESGYGRSNRSPAATLEMPAKED